MATALRTRAAAVRTRVTPARLLALAALAMVVSVAVRVRGTLTSPDGLQLVDLRVYTYGAAELFSGDLYSFTYSEITPDFPLPFTYPPFAALLLYPLHWVGSFAVLGVGWQLATMAATWGVLRLSLVLLLGDRARHGVWVAAAMAWTAGGIWLEPVRTTLDFGQVNVFLVLGVLAAAVARRDWVSGALVGALAAVKLTPAITGLYLLAMGRYRAAALSAVSFVVILGGCLLVVPGATREYFGGVGLDADRVGPVGSAINQSLRGALSRLVGFDVGTGPVWLGAIAVAAGLSVWAWRRLDADDALGTLVVVQLLGLLASPISWSHHWVWLLPTLIWLVHGPLRASWPARALAGGTVVVLAVDVITDLLERQPTIWEIPRPWPEAVAGTVYPVLALALLAVVITGSRRLSPAPAPR